MQKFHSFILLSHYSGKGMLAWCDGLPLDANPYDPDKAPRRYQAWADGWRSARGRHVLLTAAVSYGRVI